MLVRRIARPLFAAWFVTEGVGVLRAPTPHVARAEAAWKRAATRLDLPPAPSDARMRAVVRAHGGAMVVAGAMLATGRAPRAAALCLAGLMVPLAVVDHPFGKRGAPDASGGRDRFVRALSMLGGALLAGIDTEGRPGLTWRVENARAARRAAHEVRDAT
ncbi:MAG: DoxX family protein [Cellulomonadaceae bacterium]|nr:DoxX family protein [Cellulomonadaceae bacterium]